MAEEPMAPAVQCRTTASRWIVACGVDGRTGGYFTPLTEIEAWADFALGQGQSEDLPALLQRARQLGGVRELVDGRSEDRLEEAGWCVVFPRGQDPAIRRALGVLLELRREQAARSEPLFKVFEGEDSPAPGETKGEWLRRHGSGPGAVDPQTVPYYVLLVGDPEELPFPFQYQLDVRRAVGRIHFDRVDDYRRYARAVVAAEQRRRPATPRISLFGPRNQNDPCTEATSRWLIEELGARLRDGVADGWQVEAVAGENATRPRLLELLSAAAGPDLLFCACHGLLYRSNDPWQRERQGALVCQEWPGPETSVAEISAEWFVAAQDLPAAAGPANGVAVFFSCFGAATSRWDESDHRPIARQTPRAPEAFLSALATGLLNRPEGGPLAVIAHVDQAFPQYNGALHLKTYSDLFRRLMAGDRVGWAMELLDRRHAELASDFHALRERHALGIGEPPDPRVVFDLWTATNDSRGFVVLGDPAVRGVPRAEGGE